jgi:hypothetical protein
MALRIREGLPSAGLYAGPIAWLVSLQIKYALVPWICANHVQLVHPVTLASALVSIAGGFLSWRAWRSAGPEPLDASGGGHPHRFIAMMGIMSAALFTLVILLQGAAALVLQGCER